MDGRVLCAGSHDNKIYIYDITIGNNDIVTANLQLRSVFNKHNSVINHFGNI